MKKMPRKKKLLYSAISFILILAMSTSLLSDLTIKTKASSNTLQHIESIKQNYAGSSFRILEVAPQNNAGAIGYYIDGQEPVADWKGTLAAVSSSSGRKAYAKNMWDGLKKKGILSTDSTQSTPMTSSGDYDENYPWENKRVIDSTNDYENIYDDSYSLNNYDKKDVPTGEMRDGEYIQIAKKATDGSIELYDTAKMQVYNKSTKNFVTIDYPLHYYVYDDGEYKPVSKENIFKSAVKDKSNIYVRIKEPDLKNGTPDYDFNSDGKVNSENDSPDYYYFVGTKYSANTDDNTLNYDVLSYVSGVKLYRYLTETYTDDEGNQKTTVRYIAINTWSTISAEELYIKYSYNSSDYEYDVKAKYRLANTNGSNYYSFTDMADDLGTAFHTPNYKTTKIAKVDRENEILTVFGSTENNWNYFTDNGTQSGNFYDLNTAYSVGSEFYSIPITQSGTYCLTFTVSELSGTKAQVSIIAYDANGNVVGFTPNYSKQYYLRSEYFGTGTHTMDFTVENLNKIAKIQVKFDINDIKGRARFKDIYLSRYNEDKFDFDTFLTAEQWSEKTYDSDGNVSTSGGSLDTAKGVGSGTVTTKKEDYTISVSANRAVSAYTEYYEGLQSQRAKDYFLINVEPDTDYTFTYHLETPLNSGATTEVQLIEYNRFIGLIEENSKAKVINTKAKTGVNTSSVSTPGTYTCTVHTDTNCYYLGVRLGVKSKKSTSVTLTSVLSNISLTKKDDFEDGETATHVQVIDHFTYGKVEKLKGDNIFDLSEWSSFALSNKLKNTDDTVTVNQNNLQFEASVSEAKLKITAPKDTSGFYTDYYHPTDSTIDTDLGSEKTGYYYIPVTAKEKYNVSYKVSGDSDCSIKIAFYKFSEKTVEGNPQKGYEYLSGKDVTIEKRSDDFTAPDGAEYASVSFCTRKTPKNSEQTVAFSSVEIRPYDFEPYYYDLVFSGNIREVGYKLEDGEEQPKNATEGYSFEVDMDNNLYYKIVKEAGKTPQLTLIENMNQVSKGESVYVKTEYVYQGYLGTYGFSFDDDYLNGDDAKSLYYRNSVESTYDMVIDSEDDKPEEGGYILKDDLKYGDLLYVKVDNKGDDSDYEQIGSIKLIGFTPAGELTENGEYLTLSSDTEYFYYPEGSDDPEVITDWYSLKVGDEIYRYCYDESVYVAKYNSSAPDGIEYVYDGRLEKAYELDGVVGEKDYKPDFSKDITYYAYKNNKYVEITSEDDYEDGDSILVESITYAGVNGNTRLDDETIYYFASVNTLVENPVSTEYGESGKSKYYYYVDSYEFREAESWETPYFVEDGVDYYIYVGPGNGTYRYFDTKQREDLKVATKTVFYGGGLQNNNWFLKYVFDYTDDELAQGYIEGTNDSYDIVNVTVDTFTPAVLSTYVKKNLAALINGYDMIVITAGCHPMYDVKYTVDLNYTTYSLLKQFVAEYETPCVVDLAVPSIDYKATGNKEFTYLKRLCNEITSYRSEGAVEKFIYSYSSSQLDSPKNTSIANDKFYTPLTGYGNPSYEAGAAESYSTSDPYYEVYADIRLETLSGTVFDTGHNVISEATSIRYIINYADKKIDFRKTELNVLEIEPYTASPNESTDKTLVYSIDHDSNTIHDKETGKDNNRNFNSASGLTIEKIKEWFPSDVFKGAEKPTADPYSTDNGGYGIYDEDIHITTMTVSEFNGSKLDIIENYDLVYIGASLTNMNYRLYGTNDEDQVYQTDSEGYYVDESGNRIGVTKKGNVTQAVIDAGNYKFNNDGWYVNAAGNPYNTEDTNYNIYYRDESVSIPSDVIEGKNFWTFEDYVNQEDYSNTFWERIRGWWADNITGEWIDGISEIKDKAIYVYDNGTPIGETKDVTREVKAVANYCSDYMQTLISDYNDDTMDGLYYTNIGDIYYSTSANYEWNHRNDGVLGGLLSEDYYYANVTKGGWNLRSEGDLIHDTAVMDLRSTGNDITANKMQALKEFAAAGLPIVMNNNLCENDWSGDLVAKLTPKFIGGSDGKGIMRLIASYDGDQLPAGVQPHYTWYVNGKALSESSTTYRDYVNYEECDLQAKGKECVFTVEVDPEDLSADYWGNKYYVKITGFEFDQGEYKSLITFQKPKSNTVQLNSNITIMTMRASRSDQQNASVTLSFSYPTDYNGEKYPYEVKFDTSGTVSGASCAAFATNTTDGLEVYDIDPYANMKLDYTWKTCKGSLTNYDMTYSISTSWSASGASFTASHVFKYEDPSSGSLFERIKKALHYPRKYAGVDIDISWGVFGSFNILDHSDCDLEVGQSIRRTASLAFPNFSNVVGGTNGKSGAGSFEISEKRVDNSSVLYTGLQDIVASGGHIMSTTNLVVDGTTSTETKLKYYINSSKVTVPDSVRETYQNDVKDVSDNGQIEIDFSILNQMSSDTYTLDIYIDKDADGNFTESEKLDAGNEEFRVVGQSNDYLVKNESSATGYTAIIQPKGSASIDGLVAWKAVISSNSSAYVHTSFYGYSYKKPQDDPATVQVLQVLPMKVTSDSGFITATQYTVAEAMDVNTDTFDAGSTSVFLSGAYSSLSGVKREIEDDNDPTYNPIDKIIPKLASAEGDVISYQGAQRKKISFSVQGMNAANDKAYDDTGETKDDYRLDIHQVTVAELTKYAKGDTMSQSHENMSQTEVENIFLKYDMLIIGFGDNYATGVSEEMSKAIATFIDTGKKVLYTHDATDFHNNFYPQQQQTDGYFLNLYVRDKVGMDKYGITASILSRSSANRYNLGSGKEISPDKYGYVDNIYEGSTAFQYYDFSPVYYKDYSDSTDGKTIYWSDGKALTSAAAHPAVLVKTTDGEKWEIAKGADGTPLTPVQYANQTAETKEAVAGATAVKWETKVMKEGSNDQIDYENSVISSVTFKVTDKYVFGAVVYYVDGSWKIAYDRTNTIVMYDQDMISGQGYKGWTNAYDETGAAITSANYLTPYTVGQKTYTVVNDDDGTTETKRFELVDKEGTNHINPTTGYPENIDNDTFVYFDSEDGDYGRFHVGYDNKGNVIKYDTPFTDENGNSVTYSTNTIATESKIQNNIDSFTRQGYQIAYEPGSSRTTTVKQTQGFTRYTMERYRRENISTIKRWLKGSISKSLQELVNNQKESTAYGNSHRSDEGIKKTNAVTQSNKGQVTTYPFNLNTKRYMTYDTKENNLRVLENSVDVKETHEQYYTLDLTGQKLDGVYTDDYPTVWYCLGGTSDENGCYGYANDIYNDCSDGYFYYTYGNVTYTGAGHTNDMTPFEAKLFINLIVSASSSSTTTPYVSVVDPVSEDDMDYYIVQQSQKLTQEYDGNTGAKLEGDDGTAYTLDDDDGKITIGLKLTNLQVTSEVEGYGISLYKETSSRKTVTVDGAVLETEESEIVDTSTVEFEESSGGEYLRVVLNKESNYNPYFYYGDVPNHDAIKGVSDNSFRYFVPEMLTDAKLKGEYTRWLDQYVSSTGITANNYDKFTIFKGTDGYYYVKVDKTNAYEKKVALSGGLYYTSLAQQKYYFSEKSRGNYYMSAYKYTNGIDSTEGSGDYNAQHGHIYAYCEDGVFYNPVGVGNTGGSTITIGLDTSYTKGELTQVTKGTEKVDLILGGSLPQITVPKDAETTTEIKSAEGTTTEKVDLTFLGYFNKPQEMTVDSNGKITNLNASGAVQYYDSSGYPVRRFNYEDFVTKDPDTGFEIVNMAPTLYAYWSESEVYSAALTTIEYPKEEYPNDGFFIPISKLDKQIIAYDSDNKPVTITFTAETDEERKLITNTIKIKSVGGVEPDDGEAVASILSGYHIYSEEGVEKTLKVSEFNDYNWDYASTYLVTDYVIDFGSDDDVLSKVIRELLDANANATLKFRVDTLGAISEDSTAEESKSEESKTEESDEEEEYLWTTAERTYGGRKILAKGMSDELTIIALRLKNLS